MAQVNINELERVLELDKSKDLFIVETENGTRTILAKDMNLSSGGSTLTIDLIKDTRKEITDVSYKIVLGNYIAENNISNNINKIYLEGISDCGNAHIIISFKNNGESAVVNKDLQMDYFGKYKIEIKLGGSIYDPWLDTGNITKSFDTIEAILADTQAVDILFGNHACVDWFTEWVASDINIIDQFLTNEYVVKTIGKYDYTCDKLMAIDGVTEKLLASEYWEYILKDKVPTMTSNTTPEGEVIVSNEYDSSHGGYKVFDGDKENGWASAQGATIGYIGYKFVNPICVKKIELTYYNPDWEFSAGTLQASNDGSTWTDLMSWSQFPTEPLAIDTNDYYYQYRVYSSTKGTKGFGLFELQFYGRSLNESVPTMTSATTPMGEAYDNNNDSLNTHTWYAFDKVTSGSETTVSWWGKGWNNWIAYDFVKLVKVNSAYILPAYSTWLRLKNYRIDASNDKDFSTFETLYTGIFSSNTSGVSQQVFFDNEKSFRYYRLFGIDNYSTDGSTIAIKELNFYGLDYTDPELTYVESIDISTWLSKGKCTQNYKTLDAVLADEKCVRQLMTVHASVDYLVMQLANDEELARTILDNDIIAKWINLRDYALDTLYSNATVKAIMDEIDKYGYGEWALMPQIPKLNGSNTGSNGEAKSNSIYSSDYDIWKAFDENLATSYSSKGDTSGAYVYYKFKTPIEAKFCKCNFINTGGSSSTEILKYVIKATNDETGTWDIISEPIQETGAVTTIKTIPLNTTKSYTCYGVFQISGTKGMQGELLQFYAWQPKGAVPVMASNESPYGKVIYSSQRSGWEAYLPFRTISDGTAWAIEGTATSGGYLGYKFTNPTNVRRLLYVYAYSGNVTYKIQYSDDGTSYQDTSIQFIANKNEVNLIDIPDVGYHLYWRIYQVSSSQATPCSTYRLQFYGRSLNVSVPIMTSDTEPWGRAFNSGSTGAMEEKSNYYYEAFNGTYTDEEDYSTVGKDGTVLYYDFCKDVVVRNAWYRNRNKVGNSDRITSGIIVGSHDGINFEDIYVFSETNTEQSGVTQLTFNNNKAYRYIGIQCTGAIGGSNGRVSQLQFYCLDYGEREFAEGSTMKCIYDHGVELVDLGSTVTGNGVVEKQSDKLYYSSPDNNSYAIHVTDAKINISKFNIARCTFANIGNLRGGSDSNKSDLGWVMISTSKQPNDDVAFKWNTLAEIPYNYFLDISALGGEYYVLAGLASGNAGIYGTINEWWLE